MSSRKKVPSKVAQKKASEQPTPPRLEHDPAFIGLRLKGLARLVFHASNDKDNADPIGPDAAFFISTELEEMAVVLGAR